MTCRVKSVLNDRICSLPCILCLYSIDNAEVKSPAIKVHFTNNQLIQIYGFISIRNDDASYFASPIFNDASII